MLETLCGYEATDLVGLLRIDLCEAKHDVGVRKMYSKNMI